MAKQGERGKGKNSMKDPVKVNSFIPGKIHRKLLKLIKNKKWKSKSIAIKNIINYFFDNDLDKKI